jgi:hypothetical protein
MAHNGAIAALTIQTDFFTMPAPSAAIATDTQRP